MDTWTEDALHHIRALSSTIGGRGSCTAAERAAADYTAQQLKILDVKDICTEPFQAVPSSYSPYALAFVVALLGSLAVLFFGAWRGAYALASLFSLLGVWGMLAETEFASSWVRWVSKKAQSQNVTGRVPARQVARSHAILCAHVDTHRTPLFYSSNAWYAVFNILVSLAFLSILAGAVIFGLAAVDGWPWARWAGLALIPVQVFSLGMCLHADFTPFSPGANDNASGVGVILSIARRLAEEPLEHTEVHLALTGCEEVGDYGICAYLDAHAASLGPKAIYIILDEVALGQIKFLSADGLLIKHKTHPLALELARQVRASHPELNVTEGVGLAYTDALPATKRGLIALTLCTVPPAGSEHKSHWHQMSDTVDNISPEDLSKSIAYTWNLLQAIDEL